MSRLGKFALDVGVVAPRAIITARSSVGHADLATESAFLL
jgi:hypothetical protein